MDLTSAWINVSIVAFRTWTSTEPNEQNINRTEWTELNVDTSTSTGLTEPKYSRSWSPSFIAAGESVSNAQALLLLLLLLLLWYWYQYNVIGLVLMFDQLLCFPRAVCKCDVWFHVFKVYVWTGRRLALQMCGSSALAQRSRLESTSRTGRHFLYLFNLHFAMVPLVLKRRVSIVMINIDSACFSVQMWWLTGCQLPLTHVTLDYRIRIYVGVFFLHTFIFLNFKIVICRSETVVEMDKTFFNFNKHVSIHYQTVSQDIKNGIGPTFIYLQTKPFIYVSK